METSQLTGISRGRFADLSIKRAGSFQDINTVLDDITSSVDLSDYYTEAEVDAAIAVETVARAAEIAIERNARTNLATSTSTALASKQVTLVAGDNIQLSGGSNSAVISASGPLEVAVDGALQTATRVDFVAPTSSLASGVLTIGPPDFQSRLSLIHASSADALDLTRNQAGKLLWDGAEVASKASVDDERTARQLFQSDTNIVLGTKQDTLTAGSGISIAGTTISATGGGSALELAVNGTTQSGATKLDFLANEATLSSGTLYIGNPRCTALKLWYASSADALNLTRNQAGALLWNSQPVQMETGTLPHAQFTRATGQYFGAGYTPIAWDSAPIASGISLNTTTSAFTVSRAGTYAFNTGFRNGQGSNTWHGVSVLTTGGVVVGKSYATGQVTPTSAEGHTWHLLASLSTDTSYYISLYRQQPLTVSTPGDANAGYSIVATLFYVS